MPTVYVVQEPGSLNIVPAMQYGKIKPVLPATQVTFSPGPTVHKLRKELADFSDNDFLLLIGDPIAIGLAVAVAADMNRGNVQMLKWDKQEKTYFPVKTNIYTGRTAGD